MQIGSRVPTQAAVTANADIVVPRKIERITAPASEKSPAEACACCQLRAS